MPENALSWLSQDAHKPLFDAADAAVVSEVITRRKRLYLSGHSGGGALACMWVQLLHAKYHLRNPEAIQQVRA